MSGRRPQLKLATAPEEVTEDRWQDWGTNGLPHLPGRRLAARGTHTPTAAARLDTLSGALQDHLDVWPAGDAVQRFVTDADTVDERRDRQAVVGTLEVLSSLPISPISWPPVGGASGGPRLLTALELGLLRLRARQRSARALVIAQLEAGAAPAEFPTLTSDRFVVTDDGRIGIDLVGYGTTLPRRGWLPAWSLPLAAEHLHRTAPGGHPLYDGANPTPARLRSCVHRIAVTALVAAGFGTEPDVTPLSVRHTVARAIHDAHGLDPAAAFLGCRTPTTVHSILQLDRVLADQDRPLPLAS